MRSRRQCAGWLLAASRRHTAVRLAAGFCAPLLPSQAHPMGSLDASVYRTAYHHFTAAPKVRSGLSTRPPRILRTPSSHARCERVSSRNLAMRPAQRPLSHLTDGSCVPAPNGRSVAASAALRGGVGASESGRCTGRFGVVAARAAGRLRLSAICRTTAASEGMPAGSPGASRATRAISCVHRASAGCSGR